MSEKVLLYHIKGTEIGKKIQPILLRLGLRSRVVQESEYDLPVGILTTGKEMPESTIVSQEPMLGDKEEQTFRIEPSDDLANEGKTVLQIDMPMMVMCGLSGQKMEELLAEMRKGGVPRIALKAVLTPTNSQWTSRQLYQELLREEKAMRERQMTR